MKVYFVSFSFVREKGGSGYGNGFYAAELTPAGLHRLNEAIRTCDAFRHMGLKSVVVLFMLEVPTCECADGS